MQESIQLVIDSAPFLLKGAVFTLQLSIGGMFFGLVLGFILALMRMSPSGRLNGWRGCISPSFAERR
jgi:cystine transport system permease protein